MAPGPDFTGAVNQEWLSRHREEIIEPEFPIVDPNHHLWNRKGRIYLFPQPLEDLSSGHNMRATVFEECGSIAGTCMFETTVRCKSVGAATASSGTRASVWRNMLQLKRR
jgi:hypothetical protein